MKYYLWFVAIFFALRGVVLIGKLPNRTDSGLTAALMFLVAGMGVYYALQAGSQ